MYKHVEHMQRQMHRYIQAPAASYASHMRLHPNGGYMTPSAHLLVTNRYMHHNACALTYEAGSPGSGSHPLPSMQWGAICPVRHLSFHGTQQVCSGFQDCCHCSSAALDLAVVSYRYMRLCLDLPQHLFTALY